MPKGPAKQSHTCDCGRPSAVPPGQRPSTELANGCARCLRAEQTRKRRRAGRRHAARYEYMDIRLACDKWLRSKGLPTETSHAFLSEAS